MNNLKNIEVNFYNAAHLLCSESGQPYAVRMRATVQLGLTSDEIYYVRFATGDILQDVKEKAEELLLADLLKDFVTLDYFMTWKMRSTTQLLFRSMVFNNLQGNDLKYAVHQNQKLIDYYRPEGSRKVTGKEVYQSLIACNAVVNSITFTIFDEKTVEKVLLWHYMSLDFNEKN